MLRIEVVANHCEAELGLLRCAFDGFNPQFNIRIREEPRSWNSVVDADVLIHLGSHWSVYWDSVRTFTEAEACLMKAAASHGTPILGICFGAQVMSHTFGGHVQRARYAEIGWYDVRSQAEDSVLAGRWMQWHYDAFSAPFGFEVLAKNDAGVQAIRRGRSLGVQFHPEANEAVVTNWIEGNGLAELEVLGISPSALLEETRLEVSRTTVATRELIRWFLENVAQGPTAHRSGN